jgi:hypothetical protein
MLIKDLPNIAIAMENHHLKYSKKHKPCSKNNEYIMGIYSGCILVTLYEI